MKSFSTLSIHPSFSCTHSTWSIKTLSPATFTWLHFPIATTPTILTGRGTNALNLPKTKVPSPTCPLTKLSQCIHPKSSDENEKIKKVKKSHTDNWHQNLWLCTVALHMCYWCWTLSFTTNDGWETGLHVRLSLLKGKTTFGLAPLQSSSCN